MSITMNSVGSFSYAHSGRTDSSGGHRDNKNKSGLGSYHYHCGGYPAHLHNNGGCPYTGWWSSSGTTNLVSKLETLPTLIIVILIATAINFFLNIIYFPLKYSMILLYQSIYYV